MSSSMHQMDKCKILAQCLLEFLSYRPSIFTQIHRKNTGSVLGYFKRHLLVHYLPFSDDIGMFCIFLGENFKNNNFCLSRTVFSQF